MGLQGLFGGCQALGNECLATGKALARNRNRNSDRIAERIMQRDANCANSQSMLFAVKGDSVAACRFQISEQCIETRQSVRRSCFISTPDQSFDRFVGKLR